MVNTTILQVEDIMQESLWNPAKAWKDMMDQIDIALDNRDKEEFYILCYYLLQIP